MTLDEITVELTKQLGTKPASNIEEACFFVVGMVIEQERKHFITRLRVMSTFHPKLENGSVLRQAAEELEEIYDGTNTETEVERV